MCVCCCFNRVWLCAILWTIVCKTPMSMRFSRQKYWIGLPCSFPVDLPDTGIKPVSLSLHWQGSYLPLAPPGKLLAVIVTSNSIAVWKSFSQSILMAANPKLLPGIWAYVWPPCPHPLLQNWSSAVISIWISSVLPSDPPLLHSIHSDGSEAPTWPHLWWGFLVCENFSSFMTPSLRAQAPTLKSVVSFYAFILCPTLFWGDHLALLEVWGLLLFRSCSVGVVPRSDEFLMYLWGGRRALRLTPPPSSVSWFYF